MIGDEKLSKWRSDSCGQPRQSMRPSRAATFQEERGRGLVLSGLESRLGGQGGRRGRQWGLWTHRAPSTGLGEEEGCSPSQWPPPENDRGPAEGSEAAGELLWGRPFPIVSLPCKVCSPLAYTIISVSQQRWGAFFIQDNLQMTEESTHCSSITVHIP